MQAPWAQERRLLTFPFVCSRAGLALPSRSRMDALPPTGLMWDLGVLGAPDLAGKTEDFSLLPVLSPSAAKYFECFTGLGVLIVIHAC